MCRSINIIILIIVIFLPSFIPIQEDSPIHCFFHSLTPFTLNNIIPRALNPSLLPHRLLLLLFAKAAIQWLRYHGTLCNPQGRWRSATGCNGDNIIRVQNFIAIELKHFLVIRRSTSSPFFLNRAQAHNTTTGEGIRRWSFVSRRDYVFFLLCQCWRPQHCTTHRLLVLQRLVYRIKLLLLYLHPSS